MWVYSIPRFFPSNESLIIISGEWREMQLRSNRSTAIRLSSADDRSIRRAERHSSSLQQTIQSISQSTSLQTIQSINQSTSLHHIPAWFRSNCSRQFHLPRLKRTVLNDAKDVYPIDRSIDWWLTLPHLYNVGTTIDELHADKLRVTITTKQKPSTKDTAEDDTIIVVVIIVAVIIFCLFNVSHSFFGLVYSIVVIQMHFSFS